MTAYYNISLSTPIQAVLYMREHPVGTDVLQRRFKPLALQRGTFCRDKGWIMARRTEWHRRYKATPNGGIEFLPLSYRRPTCVARKISTRRGRRGSYRPSLKQQRQPQGQYTRNLHNYSCRLSSGFPSVQDRTVLLRGSTGTRTRLSLEQAIGYLYSE